MFHPSHAITWISLSSLHHLHIDHRSCHSKILPKFVIVCVHACWSTPHNIAFGTFCKILKDPVGDSEELSHIEWLTMVERNDKWMDAWFYSTTRIWFLYPTSTDILVGSSWRTFPCPWACRSRRSVDGKLFPWLELKFLRFLKQHLSSQKIGPSFQVTQ